MKVSAPLRFSAVIAAMLVVPAAAHAHPGQSIVYDCASGLAHPFYGWDHLAAMIAVGIWAAQLGGRARWLVPAAFVTVMTCATVLGSRGFLLPDVEPLIATSVLALGLLTAAAARLPLIATVVVVALFAAGHGVAHGAEIPVNAGAFAYVAGFVLATITLHAVGVLCGLLAHCRAEFLPRAVGAACAAFGAALLVS